MSDFVSGVVMKTHIGMIGNKAVAHLKTDRDLVQDLKEDFVSYALSHGVRLQEFLKRHVRRRHRTH